MFLNTEFIISWTFAIISKWVKEEINLCFKNDNIYPRRALKIWFLIDYQNVNNFWRTNRNREVFGYKFLIISHPHSNEGHTLDQKTQRE